MIDDQKRGKSGKYYFMETKGCVILLYQSTRQFLYRVEQYASCVTREMLIFPKYCIYFKIEFSLPVVKKLKSAEKSNSHTLVNSFDTSPFDVILAVCCTNGADWSM